MTVASRAVLYAPGNPADLRVESLALSAPAGSEVLVRMQYAPINPADLNVLEGKYPKQPVLPGIPGNEGVGIVEAVGENASVAIGDIVIAPGTMGAWATHRLLQETQLIVLPPDTDLQQAAMLTVNPATAWRLLSDFATLTAGDWIVVNAANSGVGRWLIQLAVGRKVRVAAVVRRESLIPELLALGAAAVVTEQGNPDGLKTTMGGSKARLAINMVGGDSAAGLLRCLAPGATMVTCGAMGLAPVTVGNAALIFRDIRVRGYWHTAVIETAWNNGTGPEAERIAAMYRQLAAVLPEIEPVPIAGLYSLDKLNEALAAAAGSGRTGKILLQF